MGNGGSVGKGVSRADRPVAWDLFTLENQFHFTVAELEYLHERYADLLSTISSLADDREKTAKGPAAGGLRSEITRSLENLKHDWLMRRVYGQMFPQQEAAGDLPTFEAFVKAVAWWRDESLRRKLEFVFNVLSVNRGKTLSVRDISYVLQKVSTRTVLKEDVVRLRGDNQVGTVKYVGPMNGRKGTWVGLEMLTATGKNDGSIGKDRYFTCDARRGLFAPTDQVDLEEIYQNAVKIVSPLDRKKRGSLTLEDFVEGLVSEDWISRSLSFRIVPEELRLASNQGPQEGNSG